MRTHKEIARQALEFPDDAPGPEQDLTSQLLVVEAIFENLKTNPDKLEPALKYAKRLHGTAATRLHVLILNIRGDSPVDLMTAALSRESLEEFESSARAVENALRAEQQSRDFLKHVRG